VNVEAQTQKVEQIVQIYLPIHFGVQRQRKINARKLSGRPFFDKRAVIGIGGLLPVLQRRNNALNKFRLKDFFRAPLFIVGTLLWK